MPIALHLDPAGSTPTMESTTRIGLLIRMEFGTVYNTARTVLHSNLAFVNYKGASGEFVP